MSAAATTVDQAGTMAQKDQKEKLNATSVISYCFGSAGANVSFYMINNYLMLFYTDVVGLAAAAISAIMLIARIWDAANDPMMGIIEDRTKSKLGKFRPWLIVGPPFLAIFNILTFTVFPLTGATKAIVCGVCYIGAGMAYTVVQVAINGLVNRLCVEPENKMKVISWAQIGNQILQTAVAAVLMPIILHFSAGDVADAHGYFMGTLIISVCTLPLMWLAAWKCREISVENETPEQADADAAKAAADAPKRSVMESLKALAKNDQLIASTLTVFLSCVGIIGRYGVLSYYLIYVMGSYKLISPIFMILSLAQMVGNVPLPWLTQKFGKIRWFLIATFAIAACLVAIFFLPAGATIPLIVLSALQGFFSACGSISYSFTCDAVEYGDWKMGVRDDGLAFSIMSFGVKLASAITGAVAAPLLVAVGYVANQAQAATTQVAINGIVNILPAVLMVISALPMIFKYRLDEKKMTQITEELQERRSAAANA